MSEPCISYVCIRPDHHRHRKAELRFTTHKDCCAYCPADAVGGHVWLLVPEVGLETLEAFGLLPPKHSHPRSAVEAATEHEELSVA
jgi:hypothetical protein